jgi:hypothetical protein
MKEYDRAAKAAASKVYRKVSNELAKVAGIPATHTSFPSQDFATIKDVLDKRVKNTQTVLEMWAEHMTKVGLHPRFPRFE